MDPKSSHFYTGCEVNVSDVRCPLLQTHTARLLAPLLAAPASNLHFHSCPLVTEATVTLLRERVLASCGYRCRGSTVTLLS